MARRLFVLTTVLLLLAVFTVAQAQEPVSSQPSTGLTGQRSTTSFSLRLGGTSPYLATIPANANGFIMGDGRICNPRWGC